MILRLADRLDVPLRERNDLLLAAGYAPAFPERSLEDPELAPTREALDMILAAPDQQRDDGLEPAAGGILTPLLRLLAPGMGELSFFAAVATFGTAAEVTTSELSIELAYAADAATAKALENLPRR